MYSSINSIGSNIRALREAYGESQVDLAQAIGFDSPGTISMLENGMRGQNRFEALEKIARHYHVSEGVFFYLTYGQDSCSSPDFLSLPVENPTRTRPLFSAVFPVTAAVDLPNYPIFEKVHSLHLLAIAEMQSLLRFPKERFQKCLDLYAASLEEEHLPEAAANSLWWILMNGLFTCYPKFFQGLRKLERCSINKREFYRDWYLADCDEETYRHQKDTKRTFIKQYDHRIWILLQDLYNSPLYQLAEYYATLRHICGLTEGGWRIAESRLAGDCMMSSLSGMGNPYADKYMAALAEFHKV